MCVRTRAPLPHASQLRQVHARQGLLLHTCACVLGCWGACTQAVERERDEAVGRMEREARRTERTKKEWALEKQNLEVRHPVACACVCMQVRACMLEPTCCCCCCCVMRGRAWQGTEGAGGRRSGERWMLWVWVSVGVGCMGVKCLHGWVQALRCVEVLCPCSLARTSTPFLCQLACWCAGSASPTQCHVSSASEGCVCRWTRPCPRAHMALFAVVCCAAGAAHAAAERARA